MCYTMKEIFPELYDAIMKVGMRKYVTFNNITKMLWHQHEYTLRVQFLNRIKNKLLIKVKDKSSKNL